MHVSKLRRRGTQNMQRSGESKRTSDHIRKLMAPPKRNNNLASSIITSHEPVRVRKYIGELQPTIPSERATEQKQPKYVRHADATYGSHERIPQRARTKILIRSRSVLSEQLKFAIRMRRDVFHVRVVRVLRRRAAEHRQGRLLERICGRWWGWVRLCDVDRAEGLQLGRRNGGG